MTGGVNAGRLTPAITGRMPRGRDGCAAGRERPSGARRQGTCRVWEGGRSRPRCVVAPVADDRRGFGRHKPPPVGVSHKSRCQRRLQTPPSPRMRHTSAAPPLRVTLGEGEHSAERAFPLAFPLLNASGVADEGRARLVKRVHDFVCAAPGGLRGDARRHRRTCRQQTPRTARSVTYPVTPVVQALPQGERGRRRRQPRNFAIRRLRTPHTRCRTRAAVIPG